MIKAIDAKTRAERRAAGNSAWVAYAKAEAECWAKIVSWPEVSLNAERYAHAKERATTWAKVAERAEYLSDC